MFSWENKHVLVTGSSGFVGSHLCKALVDKGAKVFALHIGRASFKTNPVFSQTNNLPMTHLYGSIERYSMVKKVIKENKITIVYHLAAQPLVEIGQASPLTTFESNIRGTWSVLEAARVNKVDKVVIASTTHVYGNNPNLPYKEEFFPQPSRPYETSKACADLLAQSYADTYSLPVEIPRFANIYGPGDTNSSRLIPKVMQSVLSEKNPHVWDVGAVRDFLYIDDAVKAYLRLVESDLPNNRRVRVINFGLGKPIRVVSVVRQIIKLSGNKRLKVITQKVPDVREKEIRKQYTSIQKARKLLKWKPEIALDEGLKKTFEWYQKFYKNV